MKVLQYNQLNYSKVKEQYKKVVEMLTNDDFYSAEVKKIGGTPYYRAKLDYSNRLLFKVMSYNGEKYVLLLEVIHNHAYEKSRFLNGAHVYESKIIDASYFKQEPGEQIVYVNEKNSSFNILDKTISFDNAQQEIFRFCLPLIIVGSAGSGKTVLTLEKMKECSGDILYVTHSPYLVENSRNLYYSSRYNNEEQNLDFLSYHELIETIKVPEGKEINVNLFSKWLTRQPKSKQFNDANKLYEEFKGVITGSIVNKPYLTREEYITLGIKQSIFHKDERPQAYDLFEKYQVFLADEKLYDSNIVSFSHLELCQPKYDFIFVDEIQDFTTIQLQLILRLLKNSDQFILSGDSNQIVHPNFFSWAKIKTMFYQESKNSPTNIIRILHKNYRNTPEITNIANSILKIKNKRFGSIDKESNYLVDSHSNNRGMVMNLSHNNDVLSELNNKTKKSTKFAIIVLRDEIKKEVRQYFQTPLVFSIQEAKGLEYDNVIIYNFISTEDKKYHEIAKGISLEDLEQDLTYSRVKDKSDRSMEVYKFYINALYVAITRAVKNLYIVEKSKKHMLLNLLNLKNLRDSITLDNEESSLEEWRREAHKLELQGKQEQAEEIRNSILTQKQTPWEPIDNKQLEILKNKALDEAKPDKNARLTLFEYAVLYQYENLIEELQSLNFKPAHNPEKAMSLLERKYFLFYGSQNISSVTRETNSYGIDFRNIFNQTPLMVASNLGNSVLTKYLIGNSADIDLRDNLGRNSLQIALAQSYFNKKYAQTKLTAIYKLLAPSNISVKIEGKLIKIDNHLMEFFIFNLIAAISHQKFAWKFFRYRPGFCTADFVDELKHFPTDVLLGRRKKRSYISSILSKNEANRAGNYNRKLFLRTGHGLYVLNPGLEIKVNNEWVNIYNLLELDPSILKNVLENRRRIAACDEEEKTPASQPESKVAQNMPKQGDLFGNHAGQPESEISRLWD